MKNVFLFFSVIISCISFGQDTLLYENFDSTVFPVTWSMINKDGFTVDSDMSYYSDAWVYAIDPEDSTNGTVASTSYFTTPDFANRWLITPAITLGASGNFVSWATKSFDPSFPDSYKVMISTTGNNTADFTDTLLIVTDATPYWKKHTENLTDYAGQTIYLAFVNTTYDGYILFLDSVYVRKQDPLALKKATLNANIFPNPMQEQLNIYIENSGIKQIQLRNISGQIVLKKVYNSVPKSVFFPTTDLDKGMYLISIQTTNGWINKRLIK